MESITQLQEKIIQFSDYLDYIYGLKHYVAFFFSLFAIV